MGIQFGNLIDLLIKQNHTVYSSDQDALQCIGLVTVTHLFCIFKHLGPSLRAKMNEGKGSACAQLSKIEMLNRER